MHSRDVRTWKSLYLHHMVYVHHFVQHFTVPLKNIIIIYYNLFIIYTFIILWRDGWGEGRLVWPADGAAQVGGELAVKEQPVDWPLHRLCGLLRVPADRQGEGGHQAGLGALIGQVVQYQHASETHQGEKR